MILIFQLTSNTFLPLVFWFLLSFWSKNVFVFNFRSIIDMEGVFWLYAKKCTKIALENFQKVQIAIIRSKIVQMSSIFAHMASFFGRIRYIPRTLLLIAIWPFYRLAKFAKNGQNADFGHSIKWPNGHQYCFFGIYQRHMEQLNIWAKIELSWTFFAELWRFKFFRNFPMQF